jgi:hypothetical protein
MSTHEHDNPMPGKHTNPRHSKHADGAKSEAHAKNDHMMGEPDADERGGKPDMDADDAGATSGSASGSGY